MNLEAHEVSTQYNSIIFRDSGIHTQNMGSYSGRLVSLNIMTTFRSAEGRAGL